MNKKAALAATLCCLLVTQPGFAASAEKQEPLSFKERIQAILGESPFSVFWDGANDTAAGDQKVFEDNDVKTIDKKTPADIKQETTQPQITEQQDDLLAEASLYRSRLEELLKAKTKAKEEEKTVAKEQQPVPNVLQEKNVSAAPEQSQNLITAPAAPDPFNLPQIDIVQDDTLSNSAQRPNDSLLLEYRSGVVNKIYCCPGYVTDIQLQPGETIQRITTGDKSRWNIETFYSDVLEGGRWHIYLRPLQLGLETNIIISTSKHNYQVLAATDTLYNPIVEWQYPGEPHEQFAAGQKTKVMEVDSVDKLNFSYVISKAQRYLWTPNFVFDDGFRTYINIPEDALYRINPALFMVNQDGTLVFVNYIISNGNLVVDTIGTEFQLRVKDQVVRVRRQMDGRS